MSGDTFTAQKLALLDKAMSDARLTDQDFRVLYFLVHAADRETEIAKRKQTVIKAALNRKGKSVRGIQVSLQRLELHRYIKFETKDGGTYVNGYRLLVEKANAHSTKANGNSSFDKKKTNAHSKKANGSRQTGEPPFVQDPFISLDIPRARAPSIAKALGALGSALSEKIGKDRAHSWFGKSIVKDVAGDTLTLELPTNFAASRVRSDYHAELLDCCASLVPTIKRIHYVVPQ